MNSLPHWRVADTHGNCPRASVSSWSSMWSDGEGLHISADQHSGRCRFRLKFDRGATFDVIPDERLIFAYAHRDDVEQLTINNLLSDQVEPRILAYEGEMIIHASAINLGGKAVLFLGTSGVGKSTLAASFDQAGTPLVCDDAVVVQFANGRAIARALYSSLRLHPDSIAALFAELEPRSDAHFGEKRRLTLDPAASIVEPLAIAAIFAIGSKAMTNEVRISPMSPAEICMALVSNSFSLNPADLRLAGKKLGKASVVAECVPAFSLDYARDYAALPNVREKIVNAVFTLAGDD